MKLQNLKDNQRGASLVEYALLVAMLAVVSIVVVTVLGTGVRDNFQTAEQAFTGEGVIELPQCNPPLDLSGC